ncbi:UDP-2,3-diacylglucosamine diphosphatase LpxI [Roseobacter sp.]|uniref:LpxI family protein n=1 Tax=Roseobacter sp. TaxID=1907202 RepID=UPI0025CC06CC|nr:UDP-2,3-diacylglucosamine diphosphatase LpxI [Roseobacter sp.]
MLALIAGRGGLPAQVVAKLDTAPLICVLEGFEPDGLRVDLSFRLERLGSFLKTLRARGVTEVCFCGAIDRPSISPMKFDAATLPLVPAMLRALGGGDDAALRAVVGAFEERGFRVRAAHELAPELLAPAGVLSRKEPDDKMRADADRGLAVLAALAPLDVGQGCVVGAGQVWGIEARGGTDHMLATLPARTVQSRALLIKVPKSGQDMRIDVPTVGPDTIDALIKAGLAGLVIAAGKVILLEAAETLARADQAGLVIWSRDIS